MIRNYLKRTINKRERKLIQRHFDPQLLRSDEAHGQLVDKGFIVIPNTLTGDELTNLRSVFDKVREMEGFEHLPRFTNSISFLDSKVKKIIQTETTSILEPVLERLIHTDRASYPFGAGYCISPAQSEKGCVPHQDPALVDEVSSYSISIWIALDDTTLDNGCLEFIPGSHLWGNVHRSSSLPWAFEEFGQDLWDYTQPQLMKAGDAICFDNSVIHGSKANVTDNLRLAVSIPIYPGNMPMQTYYLDRDSILGNFASKYQVDVGYYLEESLFDRPSGRYERIRRLRLNNYYTKENINALNEQYSGTHVNGKDNDG